MQHSRLVRNLGIILLLSSALTIDLIPNASSQQFTTQTQTLPNLTTFTLTTFIPSRYIVQCNSTLLNINIKNDQWNPTWNSAQIIDLVNVGGPYKGAGQTGNAFLGLECDSKWLYGFVAYVPPADENGQRSIVNSGYLGLGFDRKDAKLSVPQKDDYSFDFNVEPNKQVITYFRGAGVNNVYGGWDYKGVQLFNDSTIVDYHYSVMKTPFFSLAASLDKNSVYQFKISREKMLQYDEFGLYVQLEDDFLVSKTNNLSYLATLPAINNPNSTVYGQPYLWPDVWMVTPQPRSQTAILQSTTQSVHTSTSTPMASQTEAMSGANGAVPNVSAIALGIVAIAAASVLAVYAYLRRSRRKHE